jgi:amino acid transporter
MTPADLLLWYNIGYVGAFLLGLTFLMTSLMGIGGKSEISSPDHDLDSDVDHDVDHDISHEVQAEASHEVDHDISHDVQAEADHDISHETDQVILHDAAHADGHEMIPAAQDGLMQTVINVLGVGKTSFSIIIMTFFFLFTLVGLGTNIIIKSLAHSPYVFGLLSYLIALFGSFFLTGKLAKLIGKMMPTQETYILKESTLVGKIGKSVYEFTNNRGFIQIYDENKTFKEIAAINLEPSQPIRADEEVLIVDYDRAERVFKVQLAPKELTER